MSDSFLSLVESSACIAVTGAGGKSSLLRYMAEHLLLQGRHVLSTTTTHILPPADPSRLALTQSLALPAIATLLRRVFDQSPNITRNFTLGESIDAATGKVSGLAPDALCRLLDGLDDLAFPLHCLVEADGAARLPLKAHAVHEPQIPLCADLCIAVASLDALGQPIAEAVHRPALASERLGVDPAALVSPAHMAALLLDARGPFKNAPARRAVLLNKLDRSSLQQAEAVALALRAVAPDLVCYGASLDQNTIRLIF